MNPQQRDLTDFWRRNLAKVDHRPIWQWFAEEGRLPGAYALPGRFDPESCPWVKEPLDDLRNPVVREVVNMSAVQTLKTLIGEIWLLWCVPNDSGPGQWLQRTDEEAAEHSLERFLALIECIPALRKYFTSNRHDRTTCFIKFVHMYLRLEGVANEGNLDRKSIKNQMRSELHDASAWSPGKLGLADTRMTQFVHNSKAYTESQPGYDAKFGVDDMHGKFLSGNQKVWHFACLGCGKYQPYSWSYVRQDNTRAAMRWEDSERTRRETGEWRWNELVQTIRYECIFCGYAHHDDPLTRRRLNDNGRYFEQHPDAPFQIRSYSINQLAMPTLPWHESRTGGVFNFLRAHEQAKRGNTKPRQEFFQKVVSEPYDPDKHRVLHRLESIEINSPAEGPLIYDGITFEHRFAGVDVQADHLWVLVQAWSKSGDQVTLAFRRSETFQEADDILREFKVLPEDVGCDISHRPQDTKDHICRTGSFVRRGGFTLWAGWKAFRGSDKSEFKHTFEGGPRNGQSVWLPYTGKPQPLDPTNGLALDDPRRKEFVGKTCPLTIWSKPSIRDAVMNRLHGKVKGCKVLVARGDWNDEFARQMHSHKKVIDQPKFGSAQVRWVQTHADDHANDCACEIMVRAMQKNCLGGDIQTP